MDLKTKIDRSQLLDPIQKIFLLARLKKLSKKQVDSLEALLNEEEKTQEDALFAVETIKRKAIQRIDLKAENHG